MKTAFACCVTACVLLCCLSGPAAARCTFANAEYDDFGEFVSATIFRNQNRIATIRRSPDFDVFLRRVFGRFPPRTFQLSQPRGLGRLHLLPLGGCLFSCFFEADMPQAALCFFTPRELLGAVSRRAVFQTTLI